MRSEENTVKDWILPAISFCLFLGLLLAFLLYAFGIIHIPKSNPQAREAQEKQTIMSEEEFKNALKSLR